MPGMARNEAQASSHSSKLHADPLPAPPPLPSSHPVSIGITNGEHSSYDLASHPSKLNIPHSSSSSTLPSPTSSTSHSHPRSGLSPTVRWSYGVGHVLNDLVASCWFSYLLVFLRTVLLFPSTSAGFLLLIGQISDGAATPVVGYLSDRTQSTFGKRRLWILTGSLMVLLTFPPIFHSPLLPLSSPTARVLYYGLFIVLFQFAWASVQVSHLALVPELTREPDERVYLNSLRSIFTILSNLAVFLLAFAILRGQDDSGGRLGPADLPAFFQLSLLVIVIGSVFSLLFIVGVPEPVPRPMKVGRVRVEWYHWFARLSFYQTAVIYTCTRLMVNVSQTYIPLFLLVTLHAPKSSIASVPLTVFGAGLLSTLVCERLTRVLGSEGLTFVGCITVLLSCVGTFFIPASSSSAVYLIAFLLGSGTGIVGVSALSLICDLVGDCCESGAFVYGAMSFSDKISNGIAIMIAEAMTPMAACEHQSEGAGGAGCLVETEEGERFYRWVMIIAPGASAVLASLMLAFILITRHMRRGSERSASSSLSLPASASATSASMPCTPHDWDHTTASAMQGVRGVAVNSPLTARGEQQTHAEAHWRGVEGREDTEDTPLLSASYTG